jgi:hypothetical protein
MQGGVGLWQAHPHVGRAQSLQCFVVCGRGVGHRPIAAAGMFCWDSTGVVCCVFAVVLPSWSGWKAAAVAFQRSYH